ncbi:MAG: hypothetical protein OJF49_002127 [Ktedonobacterales bacterium]|nr:MAG: hypothetical protein OJF49_002127 [Ktedonobacterales bacterium]
MLRFLSLRSTAPTAPARQHITSAALSRSEPQSYWRMF